MSAGALPFSSDSRFRFIRIQKRPSLGAAFFYPLLAIPPGTFPNGRDIRKGGASGESPFLLDRTGKNRNAGKKTHSSEALFPGLKPQNSRM